MGIVLRKLFPDERKKLKNRAFKEFSKSVGWKDEVENRVLQMEECRKDKQMMFQKLSLSPKVNQITKVVLVVGRTGSGKTTVINAMANFIHNVDIADSFRLSIPEMDSTRPPSESQTDYITAYVFNHIKGMPFNYNFILVDTPGFADTRGIERDAQVVEQIKFFLKTEADVDQIDAVAFVAAASSGKLTPDQKYIFNSVLSMFGKDVKDNIFIMATFADNTVPPLEVALREADVQYVKLFKFNNSALYAQAKSDQLVQCCWKLGYDNLRDFFQTLEKVKPVSMVLTREVLEERQKLQLSINCMQDFYQYGLDKLVKLDRERDMLNNYNNDMKKFKDHTEEIEVPKMVKKQLDEGESALNCTLCNVTCDYRRYIEGKDNRLSTLMPKHCEVCPGRCPWKKHQRESFEYGFIIVKEKRTVEDLLERYRSAEKGKHDKEHAVQAIREDIKQISRTTMDMIKMIKSSKETLDGIALRTHNLVSAEEYMDQLIQHEMNNKAENFEKRIEMIKKLKTDRALVRRALQHNIKEHSGEAWLQQLRNLA